MKNLVLIYVLLILVTSLVVGQELEIPTGAPSTYTPDPRCAGETSCTGCIAAGPECAWCQQWNYNGLRCDRVSVLEAAGCIPEFIYKKGGSELRIEQDDAFSDFVRNDAGQAQAVQVKPQKASVALRAGSAPINVTLVFRAAKNYPLDVYYLMDLTQSMKDDKNTLERLGGDLANTLRNLTENFQLGFGSYVDKPVMPFVDQAKLSNPCSVEHGTCSQAYGFKHHMRLNQDVEEFTERVKDAPMSGNLDNAEGGLDALVQAVVCTEHIGWAQDSRKIVLLVTDGISHYAGDGLLGGAVRRNDGRCHLDPQTGLYSMTELLDYPSLAEMDRLLMQHKMNTIFAVTKERIHHYRDLSSVLESPALVATLEKDSSNIIQLVREGYEDIVSSAVFRDNAVSPVRVVYSTNCGAGDAPLRDGASCENVQFGEEYKFEIQLHLDVCPSDPQQWKQNVDISERGLVDGLQVDVELLCGCDCEKEKNSTRCNSHGDYDCGVCNCAEGWYGSTCTCTGQNATTSAFDYSCLPAKAALEGDEVCSGRGDCVCGRCECHGLAHGTYCECDDSLCDRWGPQGARCGGPGRGRCVCGKCECEPAWSGPSCSCATNTEACVAPGDAKACSGRGKCECGECQCGTADNGARYTGKFCEKCDTCQGMCSLYKGCVECKAFNNSCPAHAEVDLCHTNTGNAYVDFVMELNVSEEDGEELCIFIDDVDNCQYKFSYRIESERIAKIKVLLSKNCTPPVNAAMFAGALFFLVVLAGLILLCAWRVWVSTKDRLAYERFKAQADRTVFEGGENPLFKPATTYYTLPQNYQGPQEPPTSPTLTVSPRTPPPATTPL